MTTHVNTFVISGLISLVSLLFPNKTMLGKKVIDFGQSVAMKRGVSNIVLEERGVVHIEDKTVVKVPRRMAGKDG